MIRMTLNQVLPLLLIGLIGRADEPAESGSKAYFAAQTSESPYFEIKQGDPAQFPLKATQAEVKIAGVIADVQIHQTYQNTSAEPIEAVYVFPASTRAAVYGLSMQVEDRIVHAKIKEKEEAKKIYQEAVKQGKTASLLVQHRPNVFKMKLGNVMPGEEIKVTLKYTEYVEAEEGEYQFVFPTVVGPRYAGAVAGQPEEVRVENPYLQEGQKALESFDLTVQLNTGLPLQDIAVSTHKTQIDFTGKNAATIRLDPSEPHESNRDFILRYRLAGAAVESGLLLYEGEGDDENFFMAMIQPPERMTPEALVPREFIFIVDVSGSMNGFPIETTKVLMKDLFSRLAPGDKFNILLFAGASEVFKPQPLEATPKNINAGIKFLEQQNGGGGTEILPALQRAMAMPRDPGRSRAVVIITDGLVNVETETMDLVRQHLSECNVYSFGIGSSVNRFIIEGLAKAGMGEAFIVTQPAEAKETARRFREYIESPVLTGIQVKYTGFEAYDVVPASLPDVLASRPVMLFGKFRGTPGGKLELTGTSGDGPWKASFPVTAGSIDKENSALRYLWARHRVKELQDYYQVKPDGERRQEVVNLGLTYNLLTPFTSFVAVDEVIRNPTGDLHQVQHPLPLPAGLNQNATGYQGVPGTPEPETWVFLTLVAAFLLRQLYRNRRPHG